MTTFALEIVAGSPEEYAKQIARERLHYARLVREIKLKID
jgi:hypothetical protein